MENECLDCGTRCEGDLCDECTALYNVEEEGEPPEDWYDEWASYAGEYE